LKISPISYKFTNKTIANYPGSAKGDLEVKGGLWLGSRIERKYGFRSNVDGFVSTVEMARDEMEVDSWCRRRKVEWKEPAITEGAR